MTPQPPQHLPHGEERVTLLGRRLSAALCVRVLRLESASERPYRPAEWHGALVVVEQGAITLIGRCGTRQPLACGAVLWLAGLPLRAVANPHPELALLSVLTRRDNTYDHPRD